MTPPFTLLLYTLIAEVLAEQTPAFDNTEKPSRTWPDWMASLPNHLPLSSLAIPGTHDTMAFYGGSLAQCQSWRLGDQYKVGIRFVDIRCRHYQNNLPIFHGVSYQRTDFTQVLRETVTFLTQYPTETVLMRVMEEYEPYQNTRSFYKSVAEVVGNIGERWFLRTNSLPTLGEARGKIIILQQFSSSDGPNFGPPYPGSMSISDDYEVNDADVKWREVERHFNVALDGDTKKTYLTYTSGVHWLLYPPETLARIINPRANEYLKLENSSVNRKRSVGVVIMDYPGGELVREIILNNWM
ncbi:1-phosphatidylinositol phosphodiesterase-like [Pelobates cultripes]|nr:1-phosphatidylinositol phosphodiesterase-like [Pelobates cultripes]